MSLFTALTRLQRAVLLAAAVAAVFATMFAGSASAATLKRDINPLSGSYLTIHDDESWPFADEQETLNLRDQFLGAPEPSRPVVDTYRSHCTGNEVRFEWHPRLQLSTTSPGWVLVTIDAQLYEGASCMTNDLDGTGSISFWMAPGQTLTKSMTVYNVDEGGDWATLSFTLKNQDWLV